MADASALALSLAAGSLSTLSPCVLPLLPLVLGAALRRQRSAPALMGLGMAGSFALGGVLLGSLLPDLDPQAARIPAAWMLLVLAAFMGLPPLERLQARLLQPLAQRADGASRRLDGGTPWGALGLGALLGLIWSPCSGPLLGTALTLVASEGGALRGGLLLGGFGLGAALPLVGLAYASRHRLTALQARAQRLRHGFATLIALLGLAILLGWDKRLEAWLLPWLPSTFFNL